LCKVLITGGDGFIGKNLKSFLSAIDGVTVLTFGRNDDLSRLSSMLEQIDVVFHLAGVNRASLEEEYYSGNVRSAELLEAGLRNSLKKTYRPVTLVYASSTHAGRDDPYGRSKRTAEEIFLRLGDEKGINIHVFRLPNIFGKWSKPNYNSVVATFSHNIDRDLPIIIDDEEKQLELLYIDDLMEIFLDIVKGKISSPKSNGPTLIANTYRISVGDLAARLRRFHEGRKRSQIYAVANGLDRALYATYISFLPVTDFGYPLKVHLDERGIFSEMLKSVDFGQISCFSLKPGFRRGDHYHHSKTEKFLIVKGSVLFRFRNIITTETVDIEVTSENLRIIESIPGWSHYLENTGQEDVLAVLWANEIFDPSRSDTYKHYIL
jgi:UDP-2-acetamido-2,6-beta-L-arabino-hexul-4-ose reductase